MTRFPPVVCLIISCLVSARARGDEWKRPFKPDKNTIVLYHFDEGRGDVTKDALGDPALTLRAKKKASWGKRAGFGFTAKFARRLDDGDLLIGPVNNDKLHLRTCHKEWTIEAWVRYTGKGGKEYGRTHGNICGTDDEGFSLPTGLRGGWSFAITARSGKGTLKDGITPFARFMGSPRGIDPNHDTSGLLLPYRGGYTGSKPDSIYDTKWHHVAWQFRYRDQTHFFLIDGRVVRRMQLPVTDHNRIVVNNAVDVAIPFVVGGFLHSQNPPFHRNYGNLEGEIDELRISKVMRYPVATRLTIVRQALPTLGARLHYRVPLTVDAAKGKVSWKLVGGKLPLGLRLDQHGVIQGTTKGTGRSRFTIQASDADGAVDKHSFQLTVAKPSLITKTLPPVFAGRPYQAEVRGKHLRAPCRWKVVKGKLPAGLALQAVTTGNVAQIRGQTRHIGPAAFTLRVTDANGTRLQQRVSLNGLPPRLLNMNADRQTVALFDWQGPDGKLIPDRLGNPGHTLTWTNMGGDRRVLWPGRARKFPQFTGHGEHGFATAAKGPQILDLKTCTKEWTVEAWIRRGGPLQGFGGTVRGKHHPFHFGHICGTYDLSKRGVWELYLSDDKSKDGSMAPGVHFLGAKKNQALMNLHPWHRPQGIVGDPQQAGIRDTQWHHVAWQYNYAADLHELYLDGQLIWKMKSPDGRQLVNNRKHQAQFSVSTRLTGYSRYGGGFNYLGEGNFFGQIGEIRISKIRRYKP